MELSSLAGKAARTTASLTALLLERAAGTLRSVADGERAKAEAAKPAPAPRPVPVEHRDEVQVVQAPARSDARKTAADTPKTTTTPGRISNPKRARQVRKRQQANS